MDPGFARFILGFPHKYLAETPRAEVVKHYALAGSLGTKPVISSLARASDPARAWKLSVVTRDRRFLFSRIAGALSCFGMDIVSAEAFANAGAVVLDTFHFRDGEGRFDEDALRRRFQVFLEEALEGAVDLDRELLARLGPQGLPPIAGLEVEVEDEPAVGATRLLLRGPDCFALLYRVSRRLSEAGADIQQAEIETDGGGVRDEFLLTRDGRPLDAEGRREVERALAALR